MADESAERAMATQNLVHLSNFDGDRTPPPADTHTYNHADTHADTHTYTSPADTPTFTRTVHSGFQQPRSTDKVFNLSDFMNRTVSDTSNVTPRGMSTPIPIDTPNGTVIELVCSRLQKQRSVAGSPTSAAEGKAPSAETGESAVFVMPLPDVRTGATPTKPGATQVEGPDFHLDLFRGDHNQTEDETVCAIINQKPQTPPPPPPPPPPPQEILSLESNISDDVASD